MTTFQLQGLSKAEVAARRAKGQGNNVHFQTSRSYTQILRDNAFTFINIVLFGIGIALVLMNNIGNAVVTAGLVLLNVIVGMVQEGRAKRQLDRIALLTRPRATVVREGSEEAVDPAEIVLGDILVLRPGDQAVVDGEVVGDGRAEMDESLLSGESDHIPKQRGDPVYSGSFCVTGRLAYEAQKVGNESFANQLTVRARTFRGTKTPLQHDIDYVIRVMVALAVTLTILLALRSAFHRSSLVEWVQIAAVVVVLVPQGLFFMTTLTYATGALRMAGRGALVQRTNAIESMSNVDVLCLDKTGTLTSNRLQLEEILPWDSMGGEGGRERVTSWVGAFAAGVGEQNRTMQAIAAACPGAQIPVAEEVPFSSEWKWSGLRFGDGERLGEGVPPRTLVMGAPEVLMPSLAVPQDDRARLLDQIEEWADRGWRVLLFAAGADSSEQEPVQAWPAPTPSAGRGEILPAPAPVLHDVSGAPRLPAHLYPLALLGLCDELRPEAQATLDRFAQAGIALKVISGDSPQTVAALARQASFREADRLVSGTELAQLDEEALARAAEDGAIFGRITPDQKQQLVAALCRQGHYVAMIGDGVNDVLSLKEAHLGIAMETGSQAARGVADIVLIGDSFAALPAAFREGQRILRGMQDVIRLFLARTLYVTLLIITATMVTGTFPLIPKQNFILALVTVGLPTLFLAAWAQPGQLTYLGHGGSRRPSILLSVRHFVFPAAFTVAAVGLLIYAGYLLAGRPLLTARSAMTTTMVLCGIVLIVFVEPPSRAWAGGDEVSGDHRPVVLALAMLLLYGLALALPHSRSFLELTLPSLADALVIAVAVVAWALVLLAIWRHNLYERIFELQE